MRLVVLILNMNVHINIFNYDEQFVKQCVNFLGWITSRVQVGSKLRYSLDLLK